MSFHKEARAGSERKAESLLGRTGYATGGAIGEEKINEREMRDAKAGKGEHDAKEPKKIELKSGGKVKGEHTEARLDKRARGGATKGPSKVNVMVGDPETARKEGQQEGMQAGQQQGIQAGAKMAAARMAARPPMPPGAGAGGPPPGPGGPPGAPPPGAGGPPPPMGPMKRGGRAHEDKHKR